MLASLILWEHFHKLSDNRKSIIQVFFNNNGLIFRI